MLEAPAEVNDYARYVFAQARAEPYVLPSAGAAFGWWVEGFNMASAGRIASGIEPAVLATIYEKELSEGDSAVIGSPTSGAFVVMRPIPIGVA